MLRFKLNVYFDSECDDDCLGRWVTSMEGPITTFGEGRTASEATNSFFENVYREYMWMSDIDRSSMMPWLQEELDAMKELLNDLSWDELYD